MDWIIGVVLILNSALTVFLLFAVANLQDAVITNQTKLKEIFDAANAFLDKE